MKLFCEFYKKLLCAMLAILLTAPLTVPVFADSWVPPSAIYDKGVLSQLDTANGRKDMNLFLSNFSEANLENYDSGEFSTVLYQVDFLYKYFELNASLYPDVLIKDNGKSGKTMSIPQATFEKEAQVLLGLTNDDNYYKPEVGKGYENGKFNVTANQVNSPKKIFSIANKVEFIGNDYKKLYKVGFVIYKTESIKDQFYSFTSKEAAKSASLKKIGDGWAVFVFVGGSGPSAFQLCSYNLNEIDKSELLYTESNKPVTTGTSTTAVSEESTVLPAETTTAKEKAVIKDTVDRADTGTLILLTVAVVLAAVAVAVLIVKVYKKKK